LERSFIRRLKMDLIPERIKGQDNCNHLTQMREFR
jgi:hypothetical protein